MIEKIGYVGFLTKTNPNQRNCTMKGYKHLSHEERYFIHLSIREGKNQKEIAKALKRSPSTISREIRAGMWPRSIMYCYHWGVFKKRSRMKSKQRTRSQKITPEMGVSIGNLLKQYLSPEQVSGYLKKQHSISISHESIYRWIFSDKQRKKEFKPFLRQGMKLRRKKYGSGARVSNIPNRVPITERPEIVETKERIGDWECDTVIGTDRKSVLVTIVERKTAFTLTTKIPQKTARNVSRAMIKMLKPYMENVKTLTFDNGTEFVEHERIGKALEADTYFAAPYSSWERGLNENTNGLLRQFFPKGTDFRKVTDVAIKLAVDLLNNRPRKTRDYQTPSTMFLGEFTPLI